MYIRLFSIGVAIGCCEISHAENCSDVLALSVSKSTIIASQQDINQVANDFCNEYSSAKAHNGSMNLGLRYEKLLLKAGSSESSIDQAAAKYCSKSSGYSASQNAYEEYVQSIAPEAYGAYKQCVAFANTEIEFGISQAAILEKHLEVTTRYNQRQGQPTKAKLLFSTSSDDLSCHWQGQAGATVTEKSLELTAPGQAILHCDRRTADEDEFIRVIRTDGSAEIVLPWSRYKDHISVHTLADINAQIEQIEQAQAQAQALGKTLSESADAEKGALKYVIVASRAACPSGWSPVGAIGFTAPDNDFHGGEFGMGGETSRGWHFRHPMLCKRD